VSGPPSDPEGPIVKRLALAACALALAAAPAAATVRDLDSRLPVSGADRVRAELPIGEFEVTASRDADVHLRLHVTCKESSERCEDEIRDLVIKAHNDGGVLRFSIDNMPWLQHDNFKIRGTLEVPPSLAVRVKLGVGELRIHDVHDDLDVELGVGEVQVAMHEKDVRSVRLSSGIGEANLDVGPRHMRSSGLLGHRLKWSEGRGVADVDVEVGVGESSVELD
jgi:hypothetical protein